MPAANDVGEPCAAPETARNQRRCLLHLEPGFSREHRQCCEPSGTAGRMVVLDEGKTSHGWADAPDEAWWCVKKPWTGHTAGLHYRKPRGLWTLPPA